MIQDEFQDSNSSKDDDDVTLVIKPPQTASKLDSALHHKDKKRKHPKGHKSSRRRHRHSHAHKNNHLKSFDVDSLKRNSNMKSKSLHYRDNKEKDQSKESKEGLADEDIVDMSSKKLMKDVIQEYKEKNVKYQEVTDVRHVRLVNDVRESRRFRYKSEERNVQFLDEMKTEWRKKRLLWLQYQKKDYDKLWSEREELEDKNNEDKSVKQHKPLHMDYSRSLKNSPSHIQKKNKKQYYVISPVSSEDENMDCEENEQSKEFLNEENNHVSDQKVTAIISDVSNNNDATSSSGSSVILSKEESVEAESVDENETIAPQEENLPIIEPAEETKADTVVKKENLIAEGKEIISVSQKKCLPPESAGTHAPKPRVYCPAIQGCRSIDGFQVLNRIEEGTYGVVYRAKDKQTNEIVALKRLKMEREKEGFPITSLREINTLLKAQHPNIVTVREIVVGSNMDRIYIVMDYVEHDLKSLMKTMPRPFLIGEVKTLLMQLLCAVAHLHDNWILHRDLKASNLLLSHQGILKVGDFGLAREYGSPLKSYTPVVVTLWYRAPELLLGAKKYSTPIDMWSVGCIFGELLTKNALFPGKSESDQINRIFKDLGTPSEKIWPGYSELPLVQSLNITQYPYNNLKSRFSHTFTDLGFDLLNKFLTYNPARRITAEKAKGHGFFSETPKPIPPNMFPTWPAKSEQERHKTIRSSPKAPVGGIHYSRQ